MTTESPHCFRCGKKPDELYEYIVAAKENKMTPDEYVLEEEGTYNPENNRFACTDCYIEIGMPSGGATSRRWRAP